MEAILRKRGSTMACSQEADLEEWLQELAAVSSVIRADATFLPDFQG